MMIKPIATVTANVIWGDGKVFLPMLCMAVD